MWHCNWCICFEAGFSNFAREIQNVDASCTLEFTHTNLKCRVKLPDWFLWESNVGICCYEEFWPFHAAWYPRWLRFVIFTDKEWHRQGPFVSHLIETHSISTCSNWRRKFLMASKRPAPTANEDSSLSKKARTSVNVSTTTLLLCLCSSKFPEIVDQ